MSVQHLDPRAFSFPDTGFPARREADGTNYPVGGVAFAADATQKIAQQVIAEGYNGTGSVTARVFWYPVTATSGEVRLTAQVSSITANSDTDNIETKALDTEVGVTDTNLGNAGQLHYADFVIANADLDGMADGDQFTLVIGRDHDHADDDMSGNMVITRIRVDIPE